MANISGYYHILQIKPGAAVAEIKAAYRRRAKQLHPDRNKSVTAHQDFILLTEAYEYLSANPDAKETSSAYQQPQSDQQQQTRQRAATYANMQYNDFVQSDYYRQTEALAVIAHHLYTVLVISMLLGLFALLVVLFGWVGMVAGFLILAVTLPLVISLARRNGPMGLQAFSNAVSLVGKSRWLLVAVIGLFNCYVFLHIGLQTLIPFSLLWQVYVLLGLVTFGLCKGIIKPVGRFNTYFFSLFVAPLLFNVFLTLNYVFSKSPVLEKYEYAMGTETTRHGEQSTTLIQLPDESYSRFPGLRIFMDYQQMQGTTTITYTFEKGLFGIPVMKDYKFE